MARERFDQAFERLREQSNRLAQTDRSVDNYDEIVAERVELDHRREEVDEARKQIVSRYEPPAPDVVEPPRGYVHTKLVGKFGAAIAVGLLVLAGIGVYSLARTLTGGSAIDLQQTVEEVTLIDGSCRWTVQATLTNDTDRIVTVERIETVLERQRRGGVLAARTPIAPGATGIVSASWTVPITAGTCPGVGEIDHGNLIVDFDVARANSYGF